jgi:hypothetical protein
MEERPPDMEVSCEYKQSWTDNKGWPSSLGVGHGVKNPSPEKKLVTKTSKEPRTWTDSVDKRPKLWNILERWDGVMWTGLIWLRIGTGGELL